MSKVSIELNDVKSNIFQKGNYVISKDRATIILVSATRLSDVLLVGYAFTQVESAIKLESIIQLGFHANLMAYSRVK